MLLVNVLLAVSWVLLTGTFSFMNLVSGFLLGYVIIFALARSPAQRRYIRRLPASIGMIIFFLKQLFLANLRVALAVLSPLRKLDPGIVAVPIELRSDLEITLLANLITLTPGTLALDVSLDRKLIYVHAFHVGDPEAFRREVKDGFERRIRELFE